MASTKAQLRTAIMREARILSSTDLAPMVDDIVTDILRDFALHTRFYELLQINTPIVLINETGTYSLPTDFQNLGRLRYSVGPAPLDPTCANFRQLWKVEDITRHVNDIGYPMYYRLLASLQVSIFPFSQVLSTDTLLLDYYQDPTTLYTVDTAVFPIPRLESAVKKQAISRVQRFAAALPEGQLSDRDGDSSFNASEGGT